MHGAGVIEAVEQRPVNGVMTDYYKVKIFSGNITLMIPVENSSEVQLRPVVSKETARAVIDSFDNEKEHPDIPWNKRYKENVDKLKTGKVENVADVLNELILREKKHGLSTSDRKMFILTKSILCSELNAALDVDTSKIFEEILSKF